MKIGECASRNFALLFLLLCMFDSGMSPFFCYCSELYTVKLFCYCLSGDKTTYYVDEIWQCLAINIRWSPLVLNNAYYICMEWYSCLDEIWQCFSH